jgi:hypothetical protein
MSDIDQFQITIEVYCPLNSLTEEELKDEIDKLMSVNLSFGEENYFISVCKTKGDR